MKHYEITKPIGLSAPCREIEETCGRAHLYKRCGLRLNHLIIPLDAGSGRTTLVEYMTDKYKEAGVLDFASGLDDYIEIVFDGTLQQLKQAFAAIDAAAVYTNEYRNIISMDISGIASHLGETQFTEFIRNCKRVCENACVVFFVHTAPGRNEEKLLEKLCGAVGNIKRLSVAPYTKDEVCELIVKSVSDHGVVILNESAFRTVLSSMVAEFNITSVKKALAAAEELVRFADFSGFIPELDEAGLESMISVWHEDAERSETK